jgi:hypothetical protein
MVDRAVQGAIPIPGAWGSKEVTRICHDMLQPVMDRALKPDGIFPEYGGIRSTQTLFSA